MKKFYFIITFLFLGALGFLVINSIPPTQVATISITSTPNPTKAPCIVNQQTVEMINGAINRFDVEIKTYEAKLNKYRNTPGLPGFSMSYDEYKKLFIVKDPRFKEDKYDSTIRESYQRWLKDVEKIHVSSDEQFREKVKIKVLIPIENLINKSKERKQIFVKMKNKVSSCEYFTNEDTREIIEFSNEIRMEQRLPTLTLAPVLQQLYITPSPKL